MNSFKKKYTSLFYRSLVVLFFAIVYVLPAGIVVSQTEFEAGVSGDIREALTKDVQKGMSYVTWDRDRFSSQTSDESLKKLSSLGVNFLSLCVTLYQDTYNSTEIKITDQTPTDQSLIHVMKTATKLGIKVMLKPHIDLIDKGSDGVYWRADIGFNNDADWAKWFKSYEKVILHYAKMAETYKAEIFCVGTELSFTQSQESSWRDVIAKVREKFSGKIVYAANWDTFKSIKFWDLLDYVGIDAYFPLSYSTKPTLEELEAGWQKWVDEIAVWQKTVNKPVVFTEIGYASTPGAAYNPWQEGTSGNPDASTQAMCYEAFFNVVWDAEWLAGVYWWKWDTNTKAGGAYNRQFTPQNKPAQEIIEKHYKDREETSSAS